MKIELYQVISYNPLLGVCDVAPASQNASGILRAVPLACSWGGARAAQVRHNPPMEPTVSPGEWGNSPGGPRWGVAFPIQPGDYCLVGSLGGASGAMAIVGLVPGWRSSPTPAQVGQAAGEPVGDRFDILLPSGAWARALGDGSWVLQASPAGAGASVRIGSDGTITLTAGAIALNGDVSINGATDIGGKGVMVEGGQDSAGDTMVVTGQ